jgi:diguanylate cyclase (GGDEF)-like protein
VLFLDIDHFKLVNDSLSHAVGDRLLVESADRIVSVLRPSDTVARLGGDEFTILIENTESDQAVQLAASAATRVHRSLSAAFDLDGHRLFATAAIGIAVSVPGISATDLLRNADTAMYEANRLGRGRWSVFDEGMHRRVVARMDRESDLRQAVESSTLRVFYQPVIDLTTGRLRGFEALARWPEGWPPVPPAEFIPLAEETGLITVLGRQVLRTALGTLGFWRRSGLVPENVSMSVNVSSRQLEDPDFSGHLFEAINEAAIPATAVRLEITESAFMREPERTSRLVSELSATGVGFELDDFGTGYSSLAMLREFPLKALKVDRSFVSSIEEDEDSGVIVRSILAIAHNLRLEVIAEGIERLGQFQVLRSLGCEYGQGYLFSHALDTDESETLLKEWSPSQTGTPPGLTYRPTAWSVEPATDPGVERLEDMTGRPSR